MSRPFVASLLLILIGLTSSNRSFSSEGSNVSADLEHLNEIWNRAWLERDVPLVEKLMADDYLYIVAKLPPFACRKSCFNFVTSGTSSRFLSCVTCKRSLWDLFF
jgi:hypothetical protein